MLGVFYSFLNGNNFVLQIVDYIQGTYNHIIKLTAVLNDTLIIGNMYGIYSLALKQNYEFCLSA